MTQEKPENPPSLDRLNAQLDALKKTRAQTGTETQVPAGAARGAVDFLSALAVCSLLGYGADYFLHSFPWGLLIGLLAGTGVGAKMMLADAARPQEKGK